MKQTQKEYPRPFLLEKTKLDRLLHVIRELLAAHKQTTEEEHFEVFFSDRRRDELSDVDDVLKLDNSRKSKIKRVLITCYASIEGARRPEHEIQVDFDTYKVGKKDATVTISVRSENTGWADRALSEVEEQVERTSLADAPHRVAVYAISVSAAVVLLLTVLSADSGSRHSVTSGADAMWLHSNDVERAEEIVKQNRTITDEEMREIETRQLSNYVEEYKEKYKENHAGSSGWTRQKTWLCAAALTILGCGLCLLQTYPSAVFLWGDETERYNRMLLRRRILWGVVTAMTVVALGSKLFLGGLFGP